MPAPYAASVQHQRPEGAEVAGRHEPRARRRQAAGGQVQDEQAQQLAQQRGDGGPVRQQVAREVALQEPRCGSGELPRLTLTCVSMSQSAA